MDAVNAKDMDKANNLASRLIDYKSQVIKTLDALSRKIKENNVYSRLENK